jgi:hypothetical protein
MPQGFERSCIVGNWRYVEFLALSLSHLWMAGMRD